MGERKNKNEVNTIQIWVISFAIIYNGGKNKRHAQG